LVATLILAPHCSGLFFTTIVAANFHATDCGAAAPAAWQVAAGNKMRPITMLSRAETLYFQISIA
jgi:hypothetical protein